MNTDRSRLFGLGLIAIAAILWSTAGLYVRMLPHDVWTLLGWRSFFAALSLVLVFIARHGRCSGAALRAIGRPGLAAIPLAVISMSCFVIALAYTSVANVMVTYATVPFVAAGVAFVWSGERPARRVLVASVIAIAGVGVMVAGAGDAGDVIGNAVAAAMTFAFAVQLVMARRFQTLDMLPVNGIGAAICALMFMPLAGALPPPADLAILAVFGITTTAAAYMLFLIGGRYVPSGEAGLVGLLDVVLGPVWVWMVFAERPAKASLLGGAIVLLAAVYYLTGEIARTRRVWSAGRDRIPASTTR